ncbi:hypothetical protein PAI11_10660 [Patulibacter medicamentivorans]|uniref:Uncharacterized protein n=1 Tax=Patulibacter medicamentivorans TaxID=1097667 RepID=H0E2Q3_9ACTN|nr:hypothetical protein PAI11_10660 [Patulibacter medicamentivorans]
MRGRSGPRASGRRADGVPGRAGTAASGGSLASRTAGV